MMTPQRLQSTYLLVTGVIAVLDRMPPSNSSLHLKTNKASSIAPFASVHRRHGPAALVRPRPLAYSGCSVDLA